MLVIEKDWSIPSYERALEVSRELLDTSPLEAEPYWNSVSVEPLAALLWVASRSQQRDIGWLMGLDSKLFVDYQYLVDSDTWAQSVAELDDAGLDRPARALRRLAGLADPERESVFKALFAAAEPLRHFSSGSILCPAG